MPGLLIDLLVKIYVCQVKLSLQKTEHVDLTRSDIKCQSALMEYPVTSVLINRWILLGLRWVGSQKLHDHPTKDSVVSIICFEVIPFLSLVRRLKC